MRASSPVVNAPSPSISPLVARAAPAQSADLQQWQDPTGAVLAQLGADGSFRAPFFRALAGSKASMASNGDTGGFLITTSADANKGVVIRAFSATQSANVFETQDSTGAGRVLITPAGTLQAPRVQATSNVATVTPLIVKGYTAQSANLQEWQDISATVLSLISTSGSFRTSGSIAAGLVAGLPGQLSAQSTAATT